MELDYVNENDLSAKDTITLSFLRTWLTTTSCSNEEIKVSMSTFDGMLRLVELLESRPTGLKEAKVFTSVALIKKRNYDELQLVDMFYSSEYLDYIAGRSL